MVEEFKELAEDSGKWRSIVVKAGQKHVAIGPHLIFKSSSVSACLCASVKAGASSPL